MAFKKNFSFFICLASITKIGLFSSALTYTEEVGDKKLHTSWSMKEENNNIWIEGKNEEIATSLCFSKDWDLKSYKMRSNKEDTAYEIIKTDQELSAQGTVKGNALKKIYEIENIVWIEHFGFGLLPFLESDAKKLNFYSLNPHDFTLIPMVAYKEAEEKVVIGSKKQKAIKIKVTLQGFKSMFWTAYLWFNKKTHLFLKYEGNSGPNTPMTTILYQKGFVKIP